MNANVNDISGFDAMTEEVRYVYAERDRLRDENEALLQFKKDICEVLGVGGNSHNDGVVKLLKAVKSRTNLEADDNRMYRDILDELKKYFKMTASHWTYSDIPHFVKTAHEFALENKEAAKDALREFGEDICKELGINYEMSTDATILSEVKRLRESVNKQEDFTEEALRQMRESYICIIKQIGGGDAPEDEDLAWYEHRIIELFKNGKHSQSFVFRSVCDYIGITADDATLSDIRREIEKLKSWKTVAADHDTRRKNWVRKYKSEHERANSCDELYKKYKAQYDADAGNRKKAADDLQTYRASYKAVKNTATRYKSMVDNIAEILGVKGMHDNVIMTAALNAKKVKNHWDILVEGYGADTIRGMLDGVGVDVYGDKGNGLF